MLALRLGAPGAGSGRVTRPEVALRARVAIAHGWGGGWSLMAKTGPSLATATQDRTLFWCLWQLDWCEGISLLVRVHLLTFPAAWPSREILLAHSASAPLRQA